LIQKSWVNQLSEQYRILKYTAILQNGYSAISQLNSMVQWQAMLTSYPKVLGLNPEQNKQRIFPLSFSLIVGIHGWPCDITEVQI
jgi:hypothetical protein